MSKFEYPGSGAGPDVLVLLWHLLLRMLMAFGRPEADAEPELAPEPAALAEAGFGREE